MDDLISRQAAIKAADSIIERDTSGNNDVVRAMTAWKEYIKALPTVDAVLVRHGEWISHKVSGGSDSIDRDTCSECGRRFYQIAETGCLWNYCPNCGADMRKEGEQNG